MQNGTMGKDARRRVMIFIDGSNLYHVLKQNTDKRDLDYKKFSQKLCGSRELIRTYYYNIRQESPDNPKLAESQDRFLNALYETEYLEVKLGIWKQRGQTMVEKGVDVMIAADLIAHAYEDHYDTAILVSGDADFYPALQIVKDTGKQVEVAAFDSNLSSEAAKFSDSIIKFNKNYFEDLWMSAGQKSNNIRAAEMRRRVTDEAASPNGEDKAASRSSGTRSSGESRKPFSHRYAERRNAYGRSAPKPSTNGVARSKQTSGANRRADGRRRLTGAASAAASGGAPDKTKRRGLAVASTNSSRAVPPDMRRNEQRSANGETSSSAAGRQRRESIISRMFGARK